MLQSIIRERAAMVADGQRNELVVRHPHSREWLNRVQVRRMSPLKTMNTRATSSIATKDENSVPNGSKKRRGTHTRPATHSETNTAISTGRRSAHTAA